MPLGSMFWGDQGPASGPPPFSAPPAQQNMDPQAMQQQLLAMLAYQQQQQMAANGQQGAGDGQQQGSEQNGASAFHVVGRSGSGDIAAAAFGNGGKSSGGAGSGSGSGGSPTTSDSETSAMERFKKQRLNASPGGEAAAAWTHPGAMAAQLQQLQQVMAAQQRAQAQVQGMRRGSQDTDDSAAAMALAFGPAAANMRLAPAGLPAINGAASSILQMAGSQCVVQLAIADDFPAISAGTGSTFRRLLLSALSRRHQRMHSCPTPFVVNSISVAVESIHTLSASFVPFSDSLPSCAQQQTA